MALSVADKRRGQKPPSGGPGLAMAVLLLLYSAASVSAAPATCGEYTAATGADRALIDGFILGYVAARLESRPADEVNAATLKVRDLATRICAIHPDERAIDVIGGLGDIETGSVPPR